MLIFKFINVYQIFYDNTAKILNPIVNNTAIGWAAILRL
jgi:hypothetical protein